MCLSTGEDAISIPKVPNLTVLKKHVPWDWKFTLPKTVFTLPKMMRKEIQFWRYIGIYPSLKLSMFAPKNCGFQVQNLRDSSKRSYFQERLLLVSGRVITTHELWPHV